MIYLDTSVLFKCYYREAGTEKALELLADPSRVGSAGLSYVEVFSALNRKLRERGIDAGLHNILRRARHVIEHHALRAGDAVQLASALASLPTEFASADERLNQAARREGLTVR